MGSSILKVFDLNLNQESLPLTFDQRVSCCRVSRENLGAELITDKLP